MQTLIDLFNTFEALGDKTAFVNRTGVRRLVVSYREFHNLALKMANLLAQKGVVPGDRVLIWGPNSSWWAIAYWGIIIRGAIAVAWTKKFLVKFSNRFLRVREWAKEPV